MLDLNSNLPVLLYEILKSKVSTAFRNEFSIKVKISRFEKKLQHWSKNDLFYTYFIHILHISYTYQYLICVVLYNINAENPTHIVVI
jgi:hypothetical protein